MLILNLPNEIIIHIFSKLSITNIEKIRQLSRGIDEMYWNILFNKEMYYSKCIIDFVNTRF